MAQGTEHDVAPSAIEMTNDLGLPAAGSLNGTKGKGNKKSDVARNKRQQEPARGQPPSGTVSSLSASSARIPYERMAIKKRHLDHLKKIEEREEVEVKDGRGTKADLAEGTMRCVEAEMDLHGAITFKSTPDLSPILRRLGELERKVAQLQKEQDGRNRP
jgi:hypothetical protein